MSCLLSTPTLSFKIFSDSKPENFILLQSGDYFFFQMVPELEILLMAQSSDTNGCNSEAL